MIIEMTKCIFSTGSYLQHIQKNKWKMWRSMKSMKTKEMQGESDWLIGSHDLKQDSETVIRRKKAISLLEGLLLEARRRRYKHFSKQVHLIYFLLRFLFCFHSKFWTCERAKIFAVFFFRLAIVKVSTQEMYFFRIVDGTV